MASQLLGIRWRVVLQSTLTGTLRMHGAPRMHSGAAGGPVGGNMEIGTADGQRRASGGGASGGPRPLQKVRAVLQSTLQQLHKVQNMLDRLQNKLLDSMRHLQNQLPDKLQTVLQNTFHQRHELRNVLRQVRKKIRNKLRVVLQSTLRQLHKLQSMLHTLRSKFLNILHKLQNKLPNQLRVVLQSTLHQVHKLQSKVYQLHQYFWIRGNLRRFELGNV